MGQNNDTNGKTKSQYLTYEQRIKIEALRKAKHSAREIGELIGKTKRTINRELKLGECQLLNSDLTYRIEYSAQKAQAIHDDRQTAKGVREKLGNDMEFARYIGENVSKTNSPYSVLMRARNEGRVFKTNICLRTLYAYIEKGYIPGLSNRNLPDGGKRKKRGYSRVRPIRNAKGKSIAERALEIEKREEYGHWELDLVCGEQGTHTVLLVLTERKTRLEIIRKLPNKEQKTIIAALDALEMQWGADAFRKVFKTITSDNGSEFLNTEAVESSAIDGKKRTSHYFCHPQCCWERGTNERMNREIRRFIPKGVDIAQFSEEFIAQVEAWLNNYPRAILGGISANMALAIA